MREGNSRRQWLAGALAALGGLFCRPRRTRGAGPPRPPAPPCCCPCCGAAPVIGTVTTYTYDAQGRLTSVSDPVSGVASYTYCVGGTNQPLDRRPTTDPTGIDPDEEDPTGSYQPAVGQRRPVRGVGPPAASLD